MLAFRFGQGMYFPFSTIHYHNVVGIPLSLIGVGLGSLAVASVASGLLYYVFTQDWQALPIYAKNFLGVPDGRIGLFLGANGLMVILLQLPISYAIDHTSKVWALLTGAAPFGVSSATLLLTESFLGILVAFAIFFTLAEMALEVAGAALAADLAPARLRGTYLALFGACFGAAYGASPIVAGALLQARLPDLIWEIQLVAASLAAVVLVVLQAIGRRLSATSKKADG